MSWSLTLSGHVPGDSDGDAIVEHEVEEFVARLQAIAVTGFSGSFTGRNGSKLPFFHAIDTTPTPADDENSSARTDEVPKTTGTP